VFVATMLGSLLLANLLGSVWPQHDSARDYWHVRAAWYRSHSGSSDLVLASGYIETGYLRYLTRAHVIDTDRVFVTSPTASAAIAKLRRRVSTAHASHVYVSDEVFYPFVDTPAGCPRADPSICNEATALRRVFLPHSTLVAQQERERVWELGSNP